MVEILADRAILEINGRDSLNFLQNLITQDLNKSDYCYTYMLNNQGRYLFDFFIFKLDEESLLIDISSSQAEAFKAKLKLYKLRSKWEIIDKSEDYKIIYSREVPDCTSFYSRKDPRTNLLGYRTLVPDINLLEKEGVVSNLYIKDKYKFAIPDGHIDLMYERSIPLEYGGENLKAISYEKGCYIGQEVISRTKYQGVVRKKIYKISAKVDLDSVLKGEEIMINDKKIGTCCSTYQNNGIALIREEDYLAHKPNIAVIGNIKIELVIPEWRENN